MGDKYKNLSSTITATGIVLSLLVYGLWLSPPLKHARKEYYEHKLRMTEIDGNHVEAIKLCDKILEIEPGDSDAYKSKIRNLTSSKRFDEALDCVELAMKNAGPDGWHYLKGGLHRLLGQPEMALDELLLAANEEPSNGNICYDIAQLKLSDGFILSTNTIKISAATDEACEYFYKGVEAGYYDTSYYYSSVNLIYAYKNYGLCTLAADIILDKAESDPDFSVRVKGEDIREMSYEYKAKSLLALGRYDEAEETLKAGLAMFPDSDILIDVREELTAASGK